MNNAGKMEAVSANELRLAVINVMIRSWMIHTVMYY